MALLSLLVNRALHAIATMVVMALFAFALMNTLGDPVQNMAGPEFSAADREALRAELGLDDPVIVRFASFLADAARGDLGMSFQYRRPVVDLLMERLPGTLELVIIAAGISIGIGAAIGIYAAVRPRSIATRLMLLGSLIGVSLPTFATGTLLIFAFAVVLPIFPAFGRGETVTIGCCWETGLLTASGLKALVLPGITLGLFQLGMVLRLMRSEMREVLRSDFVRYARARGLSERSVVFVHALRSASLPLITVAGINLAGLIAYSLITETVFQWPGLGLLFIQAVQFADVPVLAAYLVFVSFLFVTINLVVDTLYGVVDPRIRAGTRAGAAG
ncbi:MAG: ABC transporter permease [Azospirillaceae bacterium]